MLIQIAINQDTLKKIRRKKRMKEIMYSIRKNRFGEYTVESSHDVGKFYDVYYYSAKKLGYVLVDISHYFRLHVFISMLSKTMI